MHTDKLDQYRRRIITTRQGIDILLEGRSLENSLFVDSDDINKYNAHIEQLLGKSTLNNDKNIDCTVEEFHKLKSNTWNTPEPFASLDINHFVLSKCKTQEEIDRVNIELDMFNERNLIPMLRFLVYFVDYMRTNSLVWGVGRGSSVASYVLFLIGVHKVNSLRYRLDIKEFLIS